MMHAKPTDALGPLTRGCNWCNSCTWLVFPLQGANYIPSHIVHTNVSTQMINDTFQYALDSNMNM